MTWASPSDSPAYFAGSRQASMQVNMVNRRAGGRASLPLSPKCSVYVLFADSTSFKILLMSNLHPGLLARVSIECQADPSQRHDENGLESSWVVRYFGGERRDRSAT